MDKLYFTLILVMTVILMTETQIASKTKAEAQFENVLTEDGYHFRYRTNDSERIENGVLDKSKGESGVITVSGSYAFISDDGKTHLVNFVADENGYRPVIKSGPSVASKSQLPPGDFSLEPYIGSAAQASLIGGGLG